MSIRDRFRIDPTGQRQPRKERLSYAVAPTGETRPYEISANEEYILRIGVEERFWANKAQYSYAAETALRAAVSVLYRDAQSLTIRAIRQVLDGEERDAIETLEQLLKELSP